MEGVHAAKPKLDGAPRSRARRRSTTSNFFDGQVRLLKLNEGSSLRGTIFNLVNSIIGGGIVGLPFACAECGIVLGVALLWLVALVSDVTNWMLVFCMDATRERSYARIAEALYGPWLGLLVDLAVFLNNLGAMVGYVVIIGDLLPPFMVFMEAPLVFQDRTVLLALTGVPLFLVGSMKNLGALQHVSLVCLFMILTFTGSLVAMSMGVFPTLAPTDEPPRLWTTSVADVMRQMPVILFAFYCQQNVPILYTELRRQRHCEIDSKFSTKRSKMMTASHLSMGACVTIYTLAGACGYSSFRQRTAHDILANFTQDVFEMAEYVRFCYALVIFCSYPVMAFGCVLSLHRLAYCIVDWFVAAGDAYSELCSPPCSPQSSPQSSPRTSQITRASSDVFSGDFVLPGETFLQEPVAYKPAERRAVAPASPGLHRLEVFCVVAFTIAAGIYVPDVSIVFGLTGSLCSSVVMYVFPAMFYLKVRHDMGLQPPAEPDFARQRSAEDELQRTVGCGVLVGYIILFLGIAVGVGGTTQIIVGTLSSAK